jgi:hypothetical protein
MSPTRPASVPPQLRRARPRHREGPHRRQHRRRARPRSPRPRQHHRDVLRPQPRHRPGHQALHRRGVHLFAAPQQHRGPRSYPCLVARERVPSGAATCTRASSTPSRAHQRPGDLARPRVLGPQRLLRHAAQQTRCWRRSPPRPAPRAAAATRRPAWSPPAPRRRAPRSPSTDPRRPICAPQHPPGRGHATARLASPSAAPVNSGTSSQPARSTPSAAAHHRARAARPLRTRSPSSGRCAARRRPATTATAPCCSRSPSRPPSRC